jgi:hypothetical protein
LGSSVASSENVDVGVPDHYNLGGINVLTGACGGLSDEGEKAVGIGFFGVEAVAPVVLEKKSREPKVIADVA